MVSNPIKFSDIKNNWARPFIQALVDRKIISGFPNGTFQPNQPMSRAQFAALLSKAFQKPTKRQYSRFADVPANHWAASAIKKAYETEFLSGYPDGRFHPDESISRIQVLISLVSGLGITCERIAAIKSALPSLFHDTKEIPSYAIDKLAIAVGAKMVVNYPNLKLLKPNQIASRGEVAAFVYQALAYLGEVPNIQSSYIVIPPTIITPPGIISTTNINHIREFRGVWVATVWNRDWPSKPALPVEIQKAEMIQILDRLQSLNFNALIFQVRPEGDALYASELEPWSAWLTGTQGKPPEPYYDPLEFIITECHKRNIELHAWFNPYRAKSKLSGSANVKPHIAATYPEFVKQYGNQLWMEPGAKVVQDWTYNVILDVVRRYDIDGVHLDDYFYPYPIANLPFPDSDTYAAYKASGGTLSLNDWRRQNLNQLVERLAKGIRSIKPYVKFGISPFGIYRPGQPPGIRGLDAYNELYLDSKKWLAEGWVDYFAPQLYWRIEPPAQSYPVLLKWWVENNPKERHLYIGNNISLLDGKSWTFDEIARQVQITRSFKEKLALGNIFYSMKSFNENREGIFDNFKASTYTTPALVPEMTWLNPTPPAPPTGVAVKNRNIIWNPASREIRSWALYQQNGERWVLMQILPAATVSISVQPGNYALCAVNRMASESKAVVVSVK